MRQSQCRDQILARGDVFAEILRSRPDLRPRVPLLLEIMPDLGADLAPYFHSQEACP